MLPDDPRRESKLLSDDDGVRTLEPAPELAPDRDCLVCLLCYRLWFVSCAFNGVVCLLVLVCLIDCANSLSMVG